jgi:hypothetical protein
MLSNAVWELRVILGTGVVEKRVSLLSYIYIQWVEVGMGKDNQQISK